MGYGYDSNVKFEGPNNYGYGVSSVDNNLNAKSSELYTDINVPYAGVEASSGVGEGGISVSGMPGVGIGGSLNVNSNAYNGEPYNSRI